MKRRTEEAEEEKRKKNKKTEYDWVLNDPWLKQRGCWFESWLRDNLLWPPTALLPRQWTQCPVHRIRQNRGSARHGCPHVKDTMAVGKHIPYVENPTNGKNYVVNQKVHTVSATERCHQIFYSQSDCWCYYSSTVSIQTAPTVKQSNTQWSRYYKYTSFYTQQTRNYQNSLTQLGIMQ